MVEWLRHMSAKHVMTVQSRLVRPMLEGCLSGLKGVIANHLILVRGSVGSNPAPSASLNEGVAQLAVRQIVYLNVVGSNPIILAIYQFHGIYSSTPSITSVIPSTTPSIISPLISKTF